MRIFADVKARPGCRLLAAWFRCFTRMAPRTHKGDEQTSFDSLRRSSIQNLAVSIQWTLLRRLSRKVTHSRGRLCHTIRGTTFAHSLLRNEWGTQNKYMH